MAGFGNSQAVCENVHRAMKQGQGTCQGFCIQQLRQVLTKKHCHCTLLRLAILLTHAKQQQNAAASAGFQAHVGMLHKKHRAVKCG